MEDDEAGERESGVRGVEPPGYIHSSSKKEADLHKGRPTLRTVRRNVKTGRGRSLARIMHEPPAATVDMAVLPGVLGCSFDRLRTSSPCDVLTSTPQVQAPVAARWHGPLHPPLGSPGAGVVCNAKRMRSLYLPSLTRRPPELSTSTPPTGRASPCTIDAATMQLCRADSPASVSLRRLVPNAG